MSTEFRLYEAISAEILKSKLPEFGWTISRDDGDAFVLCAGESQHLWCYIDDDGMVRDFTRYGSNYVDDMLDMIRDEFGTNYVDEYCDYYHDLEHWHEIEQLENKIEANPDNSDYYYSLGRAYFNLRENENDAAEAYLKATGRSTAKLLEILADHERSVDDRIPAAYALKKIFTKNVPAEALSDVSNKEEFETVLQEILSDEGEDRDVQCFALEVLKSVFAKAILLIDDEKSIHRAIQEEIEEIFGNKINVICFSDGKSAWEYFEMNSVKIDLVISCIHMPEMDGIALLKKSKELQPQIPFIIHTSYEYRDDFDVSAADAYIVKNPDFADLMTAIRKLLHIGEDESCNINVIANDTDNIPLGTKIQTFIESLSGYDTTARKTTIKQLVATGLPAVPFLEAMIDATYNKDCIFAYHNYESWADIIKALKEIGSEAASKVMNKVHFILDLELENINLDVIFDVISALGALGDERAAVHLFSLLNENSYDRNTDYYQIMEPVCSELFSIDMDLIEKVLKEDKELIKPLIDALAHSHPEVRMQSAEALGLFNVVDEIPALIKPLKDGNKHVRISSAKALVNLGDPAALALTDLLRLDLDGDEHDYVAKAFVEAGESVEPLLVDLLKHAGQFFRESVAEHLSKMENPQIRPLAELLKEDDNELRTELIGYITNMGEKGQNALEEIVSADEGVRCALEEWTKADKCH